MNEARPQPEDYQPPLTRAGRLWRLAGCLALSALFWSLVGPGQLRHSPLLLALDVGLGVASYVVVRHRRSHPLAVALSLNVVAAASGIAGGPAALAAVSLATRRIVRELLLLALTIFAASTAFYLLMPFGPATDLSTILLSNLFFTAGQLGWGLYIGSRRELVWTLHRRAERAEAERDERIRNARIGERAAIAREMHDVLAHRISQVSLQAGALGYRRDLDEQQLRSGIDQIQASANAALDDLRDVLGVLREQDRLDALHRPQPTFGDVHRLILEARQAGAAIAYADRLPPEPTFCGQVGRTLYRIVQEGITNARKHAPHELLSICVSGDPDHGIDLELRNTLAAVTRAASPPGAGLGLVGLHERVLLRGGRLDVGVVDREHVLHAWLPWRGAA